MPNMGWGSLADQQALEEQRRSALAQQEREGRGTGKLGFDPMSNYGRGTQDLPSLADQLRLHASGQGPSLANETLKRALGQNVAANRSFAASARPGQGGMATRLMMQQNSQLGATAGAQGALARMQEQEAAQRQLGDVLLGGRGQDVGLRSAELGAPKAPSMFDKWLGATSGVAAGALAASDRNLKTNIQPGGSVARALMDSTPPYSYEYSKESGLPGGPQLGPMAQDIEPALSGAVQDTPGGKVVDYAKLLPAMMASNSNLNARLKAMEGALSGAGGAVLAQPGYDPAASQRDPYGVVTRPEERPPRPPVGNWEWQGDRPSRPAQWVHVPPKAKASGAKKAPPIQRYRREGGK